MRFRVDGWSPAATGRGDDVEFRCAATVEAPCDGELVFDGLATLCVGGGMGIATVVERIG